MRSVIYQLFQNENLPFSKLNIADVSSFSLYKLQDYTGAAIRVRRDSDNVERDIYFSRGRKYSYLDLLSLINFVGNGNGYITKFYNQNGSGKDLIQPVQASQPTIVRNGIIDIFNGKYGIHQTINQYLYLNLNTVLFSNFWTINYVGAVTDPINSKRVIASKYQDTPATNFLFGWWSGKERCVYFNGTGVYDSGIASTSSTQIYTASSPGIGQQCLLYRNGVDFSIAGGTTGVAPNFTVQTNGTGGYGAGEEGSDSFIYGIVFINRVISNYERMLIENSQKLRYSIT